MTLDKKINFSAIVFIFYVLSFHQGLAQKLDTFSTLSMTGYVDGYYAYYTDSVGPGNFQKFPTASPRSNSPSLNIAMLSFLYNAEKIRAAAVFHAGDIPTATWALPYRNIMEAHVGFKIYSKLWIDAGFFRTHFGTEFLLPSENITSSVTVGTFYEPYYESGIRLNFDPTSKLEINAFLLNGYGLFVDNNNKKSGGMGITYAFTDKVGIGYTNYIGNDSPPEITKAHLHFFQNVFLNAQFNKIKLQVGGDYCLQQNADIATETKTASMFSALATIRYQCANKLAVYGRGEIFEDPQGFMSTVITNIKDIKTGYKLWGVTAGTEFKPTSESYIKLEARHLQMMDDQYIFTRRGDLYNTRFEIMVNGGVTFDFLRVFRTRLSEKIDGPANELSGED